MNCCAGIVEGVVWGPQAPAVGIDMLATGSRQLMRQNSINPLILMVTKLRQVP